MKGRCDECMKSHAAAAAIIILNFFCYVIGLCLIIGSFLYFFEVLILLTVARKVTVVYICSVSSDLGEQKVPVITVNWSSSCAALFKRLCSVMAGEYSSVDKILQKVNLKKKSQARHLSDQCFI